MYHHQLDLDVLHFHLYAPPSCIPFCLVIPTRKPQQPRRAPVTSSHIIKALTHHDGDFIPFSRPIVRIANPCAGAVLEDRRSPSDAIWTPAQALASEVWERAGPQTLRCLSRHGIDGLGLESCAAGLRAEARAGHLLLCGARVPGTLFLLEIVDGRDVLQRVIFEICSEGLGMGFTFLEGARFVNAFDVLRSES